MTPQQVKELFDYDPETGVLRWRINVSRWRAGQVAGNPKKRPSGSGYVSVRFQGVWYLGHRIVFAWMTGAWPAQVVDHVNGNGLDNRWVNLREATYAQNAQNRSDRANKSGYRGAFKVVRNGVAGYEARIKVSGKTLELGRFKTPQEAHAAYCKAQEQHHGAFRPQLR